MKNNKFTRGGEKKKKKKEIKISSTKDALKIPKNITRNKNFPTEGTRKVATNPFARNRRFLAKAIRCRPLGLARDTTTTTVIAVEHHEHAVSHEIASPTDSIASIGDIGCC